MKTLVFGIMAAAAMGRAQTMNMDEISRALGVQCNYCHSAQRGSAGSDPKPAEPKKDIARAMMEMTRDLNRKVQEATGKPANETTQVECVTCHRGVAIPRPLSAIILRTVVEKGGAAAVEQYRDLRQQYFSRATYDFSEEALLQMVERVVQARPDDAITLLRMNLEFYPQSAKTYALIGFAYTRKMDDASAISNLEKSLELDGSNAMVRGQLEQLQEYQRRRRQQ